MISHIPHETYVALLIMRGDEDWEIEDDLSLQRLTFPDVELLEYLRRTTPISDSKRFIRTPEIKKWADRRNLEYELLDVNSTRVNKARLICSHANIRHTLELCLLNPNMSWEEITKSMSRLGKPQGLAAQMVKDYHQLFWNFSNMSPTERAEFFKEIRATVGMQAAADGFPQMGMSLDFGVPVAMNDEERLAYMREISFMRFSREMHSGVADARAAMNWTTTFIALTRELQRLAPVEMEAQIVFDSGTIDMIPDVDHLDYSEEFGARQLTEERDGTSVIPFVPRN